jgi:hypothetical protein
LPHILTALATIVYYRGRVLTLVRDAVLLGLLLMLIARFGLRSSFFQTRRESAAVR